MDSGYVTKAEMIRKLSEQDMPHRINVWSVKSIFSGTGAKEMNFSTFAHAVTIQNRWYMYTKELDGGYVMSLETFFAIMHDRLVPGYIRRIVDSIDVNIGPDAFANKFRML